MFPNIPHPPTWLMLVVVFVLFIGLAIRATHG
jgi:hypothetical protein